MVGSMSFHVFSMDSDPFWGFFTGCAGGRRVAQQAFPEPCGCKQLLVPLLGSPVVLCSFVFLGVLSG